MPPVRELTGDRVQGEAQTQHGDGSVLEGWITAYSHRILQSIHCMSVSLSSIRGLLCSDINKAPELFTANQKWRQLKAYNLGYDLQYSLRDQPILAKKKMPWATIMNTWFVKATRLMVSSIMSDSGCLYMVPCFDFHINNYIMHLKTSGWLADLMYVKTIQSVDMHWNRSYYRIT